MSAHLSSVCCISTISVLVGILGAMVPISCLPCTADSSDTIRCPACPERWELVQASGTWLACEHCTTHAAPQPSQPAHQQLHNLHSPPHSLSTLSHSQLFLHPPCPRTSLGTCGA